MRRIEFTPPISIQFFHPSISYYQRILAFRSELRFPSLDTPDSFASFAPHSSMHISPFRDSELIRVVPSFRHSGLGWWWPRGQLSWLYQSDQFRSILKDIKTSRHQNNLADSHTLHVESFPDDMCWVVEIDRSRDQKCRSQDLRTFDFRFSLRKVGWIEGSRARGCLGRLGLCGPFSLARLTTAVTIRR